MFHPTSTTRRRRARRAWIAASVVAAVLAVGCGGEDGETAAGESPAVDAGTGGTGGDSPPSTLAVTADDFTYDVSADRIEAGLVTISLENEGSELHHVTLMRMPEDLTIDEFVAELHADEAAAFQLAEFAGGVNPVVPGASGSVQTELEEGDYALICFVPSPDGVGHAHKGMVREIEVVETTAVDEELPDVVGEITMADYTITLPPDGLQEPGTYRFENEGTEPHEVVLLRLLDGKTLADAAAYQASGGQGEAPFTFEGGTATVAPGRVVYADVDVRPGTWMALCVVPSPHTDMPHSEMGMVLPFDVT